MAILNLESQIVKDFGTNEGMDFQAQLAQNLLNNNAILRGFEKSKDTVEKVLTEAWQTYLEIGISNATVEELRQGKLCTLNKEERKIILDMVLESVGASVYKQSNLEELKGQYSRLEYLKAESSVRNLYERSKIQLVGNVIQIFSSSEILKIYLLDKDFLGISIVNLRVKGSKKPSGLTLNVIREERSPVGDVRKHELWHAFDAVRFAILGITENPFKRKYKVANSKLIFNKYFDLLQEKPSEFLDYVFGKDRRIPSLWDFDSNMESLHIELPAFIAGSITTDGKVEIETENVLDTLISSYILDSPIKLKDLREICTKDVSGRLIVSIRLILERIILKRDDMWSELISEKLFTEYFTEVDKTDPKKKRKFKQGKEEELKQYYQEVVDFMFNDTNSPIYQIRRELQKAIDAFMIRNRKVGPYRALVEMSLLPFNSWAAYVRLKEMRN